MSKKREEQIDQLLQTAKISKDPTVRQALEKLCFTVALAHDREYIEGSGLYHTSGCCITVPARTEDTTFQLTWNNAEMQIFSMAYQVASFQYGDIIEMTNGGRKTTAPLPGIILVEDKLYDA